ncbi:hypothetical protein KFE25_012116 [Diacronema lutheri]|uniref:phosphoethanolamine N-methyltransferase n=1 Tax=Diacronema lutheri TaxID=2081491 RepID=A0A8J5X6Q2_DIALT|nr:hypothetical protein KFE25_012116 [Diacronema lutheri]
MDFPTSLQRIAHVALPARAPDMRSVLDVANPLIVAFATLATLALLARVGVPRVSHAVASLALALNGSAHARWLNLGLWPALSYVRAARALAAHVGRTAGIGAGAAVLDVGCGLGESLRLWLSAKFGAASVVGVNASVGEVRAARELLGEDTRAEVVCADGAALPDKLRGGTFDAVVSVDACYHFDTRERFLRGAYDALRPGGRFAAADVVSACGAPSLAVRAQRAAFCAIAGIPPANVAYGVAGYAQRLREVGFEDVLTEDVSEHVLGGFAAWAARSESRGVRIAGRFIRAMRERAAVSFVVVRAVKPDGGEL